jgi:DNA-binding CsgD family transcriptional regulator
MTTLAATKSASPTQLLQVLFAASDWLNAGFLISSSSGRLLFANDAAQQILESQDGLMLDDDGQLAAGIGDGMSTAEGQTKFSTMLATAQMRSGLTVSVSRPSGKLPLTLTMRPARPESIPPGYSEVDTVLVLIHDPESTLHVGYAELRELYGLTPTEARLANLVMQGKTIEECTGLLGIRRSTVKMHLRNLYGKTGIQRQSELVSLMFKSFGSIRCGRASLPRAAPGFESENQQSS